MGVKPQHIAVLCNYKLLPERIGGMDYFFEAFDKQCKDNGIQVDWFFPNNSTHDLHAAFHLFSSDGESIETFFIAYLQENRPVYSHIITHFVELCTPYFKTFKKYSDAKIIAVDHNPRPIGGYSFSKKLKKRVKGVLYSKYTDLFVGVSAYTTREIGRDFGGFLKPKTQVVYNGVVIDDIVARKRTEPKTPKFLVASHLRESKGIQDLIEAVSKLPQELKTKTLIDVYGEGPYKPELEMLISKYHLQEHLFLKGSSPELKKIYAQYDYLLQPTHMECFSLSILESLAANVPVITTPVGGNEEVITHGKNGYIFETENTDALKEVIQQLLEGKINIVEETRSLIADNFTMRHMVYNHFQLLLQS